MNENKNQESSIIQPEIKAVNLEQAPAPSSPEKESHKVRTSALSLVAIILIAVGAYFLFTTDTTDSVEFEKGKVLTRARTGTVVEGFPEKLILEDFSVVSNSYAINYTNENMNLPVLNYESKLSISENVDMFNAYFKNNAWDIVNHANYINPRHVSIYAVNIEREEVNVVFNQNFEGKVDVTLSYLSKAK